MNRSPRRLFLALLLACAFAPAAAQEYEIDLSQLDPNAIDLSQLDPNAIDLSQLDPAAVMAMGNDVLLRAPDSALDGLFQAVHATSQSREESEALCALFDPDADRSVTAFQRAADRLGPRSRERFTTAFAEIALTGLQGQPQPYDPKAAQQVLKSAAVTATILHEGFMLGLTTTGDDPASREARCRSFRWMVGVLKDLPLEQRAMATRWLLQEGLTLVASSQQEPPRR